MAASRPIKRLPQQQLPRLQFPSLSAGATRPSAPLHTVPSTPLCSSKWRPTPSSSSTSGLRSTSPFTSSATLERSMHLANREVSGWSFRRILLYALGRRTAPWLAPRSDRSTPTRISGSRLRSAIAVALIEQALLLLRDLSVKIQPASALYQADLLPLQITVREHFRKVSRNFADTR